VRGGARSSKDRPGVVVAAQDRLWLGAEVGYRMSAIAAPSRSRLGALLCAGVAAALAAGCTYYQVAAPPSGPGVFDRAWSAALGAVEDTGVTISVADRTSGTIRGATGTDTVTVRVYTQADGSVRVEITALRNGGGVNAALAQRISDAYDRRMGR
jgi:hypothetical protein